MMPTPSCRTSCSRTDSPSPHMFPSFTTTAGPAAQLTRHLFYRLRRLLHRRISSYASADPAPPTYGRHAGHRPLRQAR